MKMLKFIMVFSFISFITACATYPKDYELCQPIPPNTTCGDNIPIEVE